MSGSYRPDAQAFDEVRIKTIPRFKTSDISGDEWRISAVVTLMRNGVARHSFTCPDVHSAVQMLPYHWLGAIDDGKAYFASEGEFCDQEGCSKTATVKVRRKANVCGRCGHAKPHHGEANTRQFCDEHANRGDSDLDDCQQNYLQETT